MVPVRAKARGYNMIDVEISRGAWRGREGARVRQYVGKFAARCDTEQEEICRVLRGVPGSIVCADAVAKTVARFRHVFSPERSKREGAALRLRKLFSHMECMGWGSADTAANGWPVFLKHSVADMPNSIAKKQHADANLPGFGWVPFPARAPRADLKQLQSEQSGACPKQQQQQQQQQQLAFEVPCHVPAPNTLVQEDSNTQPLGAPALPQVELEVPHEHTLKTVEDESAQLNTAIVQAWEQHAEIPRQMVARKDAGGLPSDEAWFVLHEGHCSSIDSYKSFRAYIERTLGAMKDPGVYAMHDQDRKNIFCIFAHCNAAACKDCTRKVRAEVPRQVGAQRVKILAKGRHGVLAKPDGGRLWNVAEQFVLNKHFPRKDNVKAEDVRRALAAEGLSLRCSARQLSNWLSRQKEGPIAKPSAGVLVSELDLAVRKWLRDDTWQERRLDALFVLPGFIISPEHVVIVFTCRGMLERAKAAQRKLIKLVVDGKQKAVANQYTIVTLSFLVSSEKVSLSRPAGPRRGPCIEAHTSTQEPFVQALCDSESFRNMTAFFQAAIDLADKECGLDLRNHVIQVHKDFSKGLEAARTKAFPLSRPCDDYAHMRRATFKVFETLMRVPTQAGTGGAQQKGKGKGVQRPARESVRDKDFQQLQRLLATSRFIPSIQLFDATWHHIFRWLETRGHKRVAEYLQTHYFYHVAPEDLQKQMRCGACVYGRKGVWFASFWSGILSTYPGTESGTQTIESMHSHWQRVLSAACRAAPQAIFDSMQQIYTEHWCQKYAWKERRAFTTWPQEPAPALLNGQTLRTQGRSPAIDFLARAGAAQAHRSPKFRTGLFAHWAGRPREAAGRPNHILGHAV